MTKIQSWWPQHLLYHHVTFTIPKELRVFFKRHRSALKILPSTAAWSIRYFVQKQQNIHLWILWVIHTFWSQLNRNPHTHLLVSHWWFRNDKSFQKKVFLPYKAIATSRTKLLIKFLKQRCRDNLAWDTLRSELRHLNEFYNYHSKITWKKSNRHVDFGWKPRKFKQIIWYLWRYLKRPAISQSRILSYKDNLITYKYIDKRDQKTKIITCSTLDFMWRLLQHLPNKHFHMVYYYGIFANRCKSWYLKILRTFFWNKETKLPTIAQSFSERIYFFTWKNPLLCECWWIFCKYKITLPWYPTKYFDSW